METGGQSKEYQEGKNQIQVYDIARIKTRAGPTMRKQGRAKDLRDLGDRFGSGSQVDPPHVSRVMMWHIFPIYEESFSPAIPTSLFLYPFKGKALKRLIQEVLLHSMSKMAKSNG